MSRHSISPTANRGHQTDPSALLDVKAVAQLCGCSERHIYRMSGEKMPAPVRLGSLVRWVRRTGDPTTGIEDWIAAGCPAVSDSAAAGGRC